MIFEKGFNLKKGISDFSEEANINNISTGLIGGGTLALVSLPLVIKAGQSAGLSPEVISSWTFSIFFFGSIVGIILAIGYQQPIAGAWSIPGIFAVTQVIGNFSMNEAVFGFFIAGLIVFILGISGTVKKAVNYIPNSIMMAMVAGVLFKWALGMIDAFDKAPVICLAGAIGYWVSKKLWKSIPPVLGTFIFGIIVAGFLGQLSYESINFGIAHPIIFRPAFSWQAILSISIPLAMLVIGAENMQAYGVLKEQGYDAPINSMTILSGIGGMIAPWMGGHNANIAGPMTAICSAKEAGKKSGRYVAGISNGIAFGIFGILAPLSLSMIDLLPTALVNLLVGLVLMGIITGALKASFGTDRFAVGSFVALVIGISGITILQIGAAFWAVVLGSVVSLLFEPDDFKQMLESKKEKKTA